MLKFRPDVVLSNEFGARTLLASLTAKLIGHRLVVYSESTPHTEAQSNRSQLAMRRLLRNRPDAYICNGIQSRDFLENLGIRSQNIFEVGQALDLETFEDQFELEDRKCFREQWKIKGVCYLFVGHLTKHKGAIQLLKAWREFCESNPGDVTLLMAGEGDQHRQLKAMIEESGLKNVQILGFVQRKELAKIYSASDVFAFPTLGDCFSLAFEEAMAASLPVIGSCYGGESELVVEGENGWVADPLNHDDLVAKLRLAFAAKAKLAQMGQAAHKSVSRMGIDKVATRIRRAIDYTLESPKQRSQLYESV
jgi:glycosyltransferase involved in cell wall biosynthesis